MKWLDRFSKKGAAQEQETPGEPSAVPPIPPDAPARMPPQPNSPPIQEAVTEASAQASKDEAPKAFWAKTWDALNAPIPGTPSFGMDREFMDKIAERLVTTRSVLVDKVRKLVTGRTKIDEELLEELEELLIEADMGVKVAEGAIAHLRQQAKAGGLSPIGITQSLATYLKTKLRSAPLTLEMGHLQIVMLVGVNGTGKTTTLGKLAHRCKLQGLKTMVAAADTFRAAAVDQLEVWAERAEVPIIRHQEGGDAAAVVFDAIAAAKSRGTDVLLIDTAGRLHNKTNLMAELEKIRRIVDREAPGVPREVLLVLDATTGQNGLRQADVFGQAVQITGCVLTKLDGTAKGGVIFSIQDQLGLPVKLVGLGEAIADLRDFDPEVFVDALFSDKTEKVRV